MEKEDFYIIVNETLEKNLQYEKKMIQKLKNIYIENIKKNQDKIISVKDFKVITKEIFAMSLDNLNECNVESKELIQTYETNANMEKYNDLFIEKIKLYKESNEVSIKIDSLYLIVHYISSKRDSEVRTECINLIRKLYKQEKLANTRIEKITGDMKQLYSLVRI